MAGPYVPERQTEYWTSRQIEDRLIFAGYDMDVWPIPTRLERVLPADFVFTGDQLKLFGLQYKALYADSGGDYWPISSRQHATMLSFDWIYYCLSDVDDRSQRRRALDLARFVESRYVLPTKLIQRGFSDYCRWGVFVNRLEDCSFGRLVDAEIDATSQLLEAGRTLSEIGLYADLFLVDLAGKYGVRVSTAIDERIWFVEDGDESDDHPF
jgi:hypothetical protein